MHGWQETWHLQGPGQQVSQWIHTVQVKARVWQQIVQIVEVQQAWGDAQSSVGIRPLLHGCLLHRLLLHWRSKQRLLGRPLRWQRPAADDV